MNDSDILIKLQVLKEDLLKQSEKWSKKCNEYFDKDMIYQEGLCQGMSDIYSAVAEDLRKIIESD